MTDADFVPDIDTDGLFSWNWNRFFIACLFVGALYAINSKLVEVRERQAQFHERVAADRLEIHESIGSLSKKLDALSLDIASEEKRVKSTVQPRRSPSRRAAASDGNADVAE